MKIHENTRSTISRLARLYLVGSLICFYGLAHAGDVMCECQFKDKTPKAYGTKAACTAVTNTGRTVCNISFGGMGAEPHLVRQVLNQDPGQYDARARGLLIEYLKRMSDRQALAERAFLEAALPVFMRGAYLRADNGIDDLKGMNDAVEKFVKKNIEKIAAAFLGGSEYKDEIAGVTFFVSRNTVSAAQNGTYVYTVFMPLEK